MTKVVVYIGSEKFRLHEQSDIELRFSLPFGWHLFRQIEIENKGFFKLEKSQICVLKGSGLPYCVIIDGAVVAGKRYNRKSVQGVSPEKFEHKQKKHSDEIEGKLHSSVIDGCIQVLK